MIKIFRMISALFALLGLAQASLLAAPGDYFAIEVLDDATGRGVPMVELQSTTGARYYTDSNGLIAFYEPGLMNRKVWFAITSHGYEFPPDGFGLQGAALETKPGGSAKLRIKRLNVAERLYRVTGYGIYRDTILLGRKPPITEGLLNGEVTGQDGVLSAVYRGKLYWFYGDTGRLAYGLGNFAMSGATTDVPEAIDPAVGLNLHYFTGQDGFSRRMSPMKGEGVVWLSGLIVLPDESGRERMVAYFQRRKGLGAVLENGFVAYNDTTETFEKIKDVPLNPALYPPLYFLRVKDGGLEYLCFSMPYPAVRVRAEWKSYLDLSSYEGYTCLKQGTRYVSANQAELDRDSEGRLVWAWKNDTPPLTAKEEQDLIKRGKMKREESPERLQDADSGKPILLSNSSCFWNDYRKRYIMIASEVGGATVLGEVWYSEAEHPEGPWIQARKIITHANKKGDAHDFYNPTQHPFFDRDGGRYIFLEGSYVNTFSGNPHPTPYYEYNQIMYRLDLSDQRLWMPSSPLATTKP